MSEKLVQRSQKLAFYGIPTAEGATVTYTRMRGFTDASTSKNAKEYTRQYVDESAERSDVIGFSPSISYAFDRYTDNAVHTDIVELTDGEYTGSDAIRSILIVDMTTSTGTDTTTTYDAIKRDFTVIPDSEGSSLDAYTYSGTFKANGDKETGTAVLDTDKGTATFTAAS